MKHQTFNHLFIDLSIEFINYVSQKNLIEFVRKLTSIFIFLDEGQGVLILMDYISYSILLMSYKYFQELLDPGYTTRLFPC